MLRTVLLTSEFTRRERQLGGYVAVVLWGASVATLLALAAWSAEPNVLV